ncbi:MAG TPA: HAD domain-containing protein [Verrucomicrobiae bacterium]|nr:HAD domain-containing protein [Verrucomicrobiae bacterium]
MRAKDRTRTRNRPARRPLLLVDIDGVISLFARQTQPASAPTAPSSAPAAPLPAPAGASLHSIDGMLHYLSADAARHLLSLARVFDLVWASGWEEKADEYLPHLLGVPAGLPFLRFSPGARRGSAGGRSVDAHWKLDAVDAYVEDRALAWIDDAFDESCHTWATARRAPTLLVPTEPERGLTRAEVRRLEAWAAEL